jgi:glycosyltransferase involved in cell wall biosynthesis
MEAMAMEIPVVSTKVSGVPELVKDGAGILVDPEDVRGLADAIENVFKMSDQERKAMGKIGRGIVEREFSLEKEVRKLVEMFNG